MRFLLCVWFAAMGAAINPTIVQSAIEGEAQVTPTEATAPLPRIDLPPSRIGRLSLRSGNVSLRASGETGWRDAELNQPVFDGTALRTDPQARAEIRIGANTIDLSNGTEIEIASLSGRVTQIAVWRGRIHLRLRQVGDGETVEIDIRQGGIWLLDLGIYDIDAGSGDDPSRVTVFEGAARFVGGSSDTLIEAGSSAVVTGADPVTATSEPAADDFVEWCRERDYDATRLAAPYHISPNMTGFDELDAAGSWKLTSEYGPVWVPHAMPEHWAPYRDGHWSWVVPWGWTWIDDQSWGFAPSHYGRWALIEEHWAWVPGSFAAHPLYAPAVVAFLGTPGIGLSTADGAAVGWFPLAPGEAYWPSYTRDLSYVRNLNLGNVGDIETIGMQADGEPPLEVFNRDFANRQFASVVPRPIFLSERPVAPALVALPEQRLQNAPVLMGSPQIAPASPPRVARAAIMAGRLAVQVSRKGGAKPTRSASIQTRGREQPVAVRGAHLRAPTYAGLSRGRQVLVLRVAHTPRGGAGKGTRH